MTIRVYGYEGGVHGQPVQSPPAAASGETAFTESWAVGGATHIFSNAAPIFGSMCGAISLPNSSAYISQGWDVPAHTAGAASVGIVLPSNTTGDWGILRMASGAAGASPVVRVTALAGGRLSLRNPGNTQIWTTPSPLPTGVPIWVEVAYTINGAASTAQMRVLSAAGSVVFDSTLLACNLNTAPVISARYLHGTMAGLTAAYNVKADHYRHNDSAATLFGVPSSDTANAGPDQNTIAWDTVTLTGAGSATGAWSQLSGPPVTLSGSGATRTFTATPSDVIDTSVTRVFRYTVGAATDDTTITTGPSDWHHWDGAGALKAARLEALT